MFSILLLVVIVVVVVAATSNRKSKTGGPTDGNTVREFFQYLLLYGLLVVVCIGLSGLLGRVLGADDVLVADEGQLARSLAFTVVGLPLFVALGLWTRRALARDPAEARSHGWALYVTAASVTTLAVAMTALYRVLGWALDVQSYESEALAQLLVWGFAWAAHWLLDRRLTPERARGHHLLGSLFGLVIAAVGLASLLGGALSSLLGLEGDDLVNAGGDPMREGLVLLLVGAPVWLVYWLRTAAKEEREQNWLGYVLLLGVGGGLVTAVVSASVAVYMLLVWLVGDPSTSSAAEHFEDLPYAVATAVVGAAVWWYHHAVLRRGGTAERTEIGRVYEYLMAGIGLVTAAGGLVTLVVALVDALTGTEDVLVDPSLANTLIFAVTLLAVGGPVWWVYWRRAQSATREAPAVELASPTRRIYLLVLLGVGGVTAVIALLVGVYLLFEDIVEGTFGAETLRRTRFAIGFLLATGAIAAYHWTVFRADRVHAPATPETRGPRFVLLVGPRDATIAATVAKRTRGQVQAWARPDDGQVAWTVDEVMAAIGGTTADEVIVLADGGSLRAIPVDRG